MNQASTSNTTATNLIAVPAGDHIEAVADRRHEPKETKGGRRTKTPVPVVLTGDAAPMPRATDKEVRAAKKRAAAATKVTDLTQEHIAAAKAPTPTNSPVVVDEAGAKLLEQVNPDAPAPAPANVALPTGGYQGPMRSLRERLKQGAYKKMPNGQPACGDNVATILGSLEPAEVVKALMVAMDLDANPYAHLNIGQQSMNLRNKMRGQMKRGELGEGVLREAVEVVLEQRPAPAAAQTPAPATTEAAPAPQAEAPAPAPAPEEKGIVAAVKRAAKKATTKKAK